MRVYEIIGTDQREGVPVVLTPYPHVVLGEGGHKRSTWIPLGKRDAERIISWRSIPCPRQGKLGGLPYIPLPTEVGAPCPLCGELMEEIDISPVSTKKEIHVRHPRRGEIKGDPRIYDVEVIALKKAEGEPKYLIVAPRPRADNRILVLWRVPSGFRGRARITADKGVTVIASDVAWHSGCGRMGETAEMLAILKPGQELRASRSGRRVQDTKAKLAYDGNSITVTFDGEEMEAALANEVEGEYL